MGCSLPPSGPAVGPLWQPVGWPRVVWLGGHNSRIGNLKMKFYKLFFFFDIQFRLTEGKLSTLDDQIATNGADGHIEGNVGL